MIYVLVLVAGLGVGYYLRQLAGERLKNSAEQQIRQKLENSEREAKGVLDRAEGKATAILEEAKKEEKERKAIIERTEERLLKKEDLIDKDSAELRLRNEELKKESERIVSEKQEALKIKEDATAEMAKIAKLTTEEAKTQIINRAKEDNKDEIVHIIQKLEKEKKDEVEKKSLDIIATALQRYSRSHVADITTSYFTLPSEDLKGKIIGREGRNIRSLERLTGAEFIIDESPDTILISSFDPIRREVAKMTLEKLIQDGRIQPAKIEEKAEEALNEIEKRTQQIGEDAVYEAGVLDLPKEIVHLLGKLHFRTSYGQNVLTHSIEVALLSGMIAEELGVSVDIAKKRRASP